MPAERLTSAVRTGVRYAANNQYLRATLVRAFAFFPFGSAYWALLPLVARSQMTEGPQLYGILLGAIGAGAIAGSFALNWLKEKLGRRSRRRLRHARHRPGARAVRLRA